MVNPEGGRRVWSVVLLAGAAFVAWEAARYALAAGRRGRFHIEGPYFILVVLCVAAVLVARPQPSAPTEPHARLERPVRVLAACVVWALLLYWPSLSFGLLSDDFVLVERAQRGQVSGVLPGGFWRPVPLWLFGVLASGGPATLHLLNVLLHASNGWLVARLARSMGLGRNAALVAGGLFLTFPANVEAVAWCSGLQDVLMTTAVLAGMSVWGESWLLRWRILSALLALVVAIGTKETGVVLPALGLIVWGGRLPTRENIAIAMPSGIAAGAYVLWRVLRIALPDHYDHSPTRFIAKELLARSFGGLSIPYHSDLASIGVALALTTAIVMPLLLGWNAIIWREDRAAFDRSIRAALWVVIAVAPVYRYFHVASDLGGSRYLYLPSAGWSILIVAMMTTALSRLTVRLGSKAALAGVLLLAWALILRVHLIPWQEASALRDATLHAAAVALASRRCGPGSSFADLPDSVRGAYVFRNGFGEALSGAFVVGGEPCDLRWRDGSFGP